MVKEKSSAKSVTSDAEGINKTCKDLKFFRFEDQLTPDIENIAEKELGETPEIREKCFQALLKEIVESNWGSFTLCTDRKFLLRFLRTSKFNVQKAHQRLKKYYEFRMKYFGQFKEVYRRVCDKELDAIWCFFGPYRCSDGSLLQFLLIRNWDTSAVNYIDLFLASVLHNELVMEKPTNLICGITTILDFRNVTIKHCYQSCSLQAIQLCSAFQNSFPCRIRSCHFVNIPKFCYYMYETVKHFIPAKLHEKLMLHSSMESLHRYIPQEILPEDYGGKLPPLDVSCLRQTHAEKTEFIKNVIGRRFANQVEA